MRLCSTQSIPALATKLHGATLSKRLWTVCYKVTCGFVACDFGSGVDKWKIAEIFWGDWTHFKYEKGTWHSRNTVQYAMNSTHVFITRAQFLQYENYCSMRKRYGIDIAPVGTVCKPSWLNVHTAMTQLVRSQHLCTNMRHQSHHTTKLEQLAVASTCRSHAGSTTWQPMTWWQSQWLSL